MGVLRTKYSVREMLVLEDRKARRRRDAPAGQLGQGRPQRRRDAEPHEEQDRVELRRRLTVDAEVGGDLVGEGCVHGRARADPGAEEGEEERDEDAARGGPALRARNREGQPIEPMTRGRTRERRGGAPAG